MNQIKQILRLSLLLAVLHGSACSRQKPEPPLTDAEAARLLLGVSVRYADSHLLLSSGREPRVTIVPNSQKPAGTNFTVRTRILIPDPSTAELVALWGEITFSGRPNERTRIGFRQLDAP